MTWEDEAQRARPEDELGKVEEAEQMNKADELRRRIHQAETNYQQRRQQSETNYQRCQQRRPRVTARELAIGLIITGAFFALFAYFLPILVPAELVDRDVVIWRVCTIIFGSLMCLRGLYTLFRHR